MNTSKVHPLPDQQTAAQGPPPEITAANNIADDDSGEDHLQQLKELLGEWKPPSDEKARINFVRSHYHHELFSVRGKIAPPPPCPPGY